MRSKREETKEQISKRILSEAFEVFAENGYTKTTLSEIAKRAECAVGIVNKYFESKEKLLLTLIEQHILNDLFRNTDNCTMDEALDRFLDGIKNAIKANRTRATFDRMLVSSTDLPFDVIDCIISAESSHHLLEMIGQAQKRGELPSAESPAGLLFGLYKGTVIISRWYRELKLCMPDNDSLLFIIAYDRKALSRGAPTYFATHTPDY